MADDTMLRRQITVAEAQIIGEHNLARAREILGVPKERDISRADWLEAIEIVKRALKITAPAPEKAAATPRRRKRQNKNS